MNAPARLANRSDSAVRAPNARRARRLSVAVTLLAASLVACSSASSDTGAEEHVGEQRSSVIKGKNSDASQDAVVLLLHFDPTQNEIAECTGTLLSDRLVLTARHCVADTDEAAACDVQGKPLAQGTVHDNYPATSLYVFTGDTRPDFTSPTLTPAGVGAQVLDDGSKNLCNHDIALVVLDKPIAGAKIAPLRLDGDLTKGELITAVGWGVTDKTTTPAVRQQRTGIAIMSVGPDGSSAAAAVPPNEFLVGESICSGDSGGPAIADTGAVVGLVSRGGNATTPDPNNPSAQCIDGENLYTKVAPFKDFILAGYALVDAEPWYENGADPRLAKASAACTLGTECRSNLCLADPDQQGATTCATDCSATPCAEGLLCNVEGAAHVCRSSSPLHATTTTTGCAVRASGTGSSAGFGLLLGVMLALVARNRRRA